jgi:uncharacterized protein (DUF488 family)
MAPTAGQSARKTATQEKAAPAKRKSGSRHPPLTIFTVGHSTRTIDDFIALLHAHHVRQLVDVRTIPRSRHNPQFAQDQLGPALEQAGIRYRHAPALGGLRHARRDSINTAWRNASFRGYADYMETPPFGEAIEDLIARARKRSTAIMCAEAVPWRCHRSLIADALLVRGIDAEEIAGPTRTEPHKLTSWAKVQGQSITYPGESAAPAEDKPAPARARRSPKRE